MEIKETKQKMKRSWTYEEITAILKVEIKDEEEDDDRKDPLFGYNTEDSTSYSSKSAITEAKEKKFMCSECVHKTNFISDLKRHIRSVHRKEKPYKCPDCGFRAARAYGLKMHAMVVHGNSKPFQCTSCEFRTNLLSTLKFHVKREHEKKEVYDCNYCSYKTDVLGQFNRHTKTKHTQETSFCSYCSPNSECATDISNHIEAIHKMPDVHQLINSDKGANSKHEDSECIAAHNTNQLGENGTHQCNIREGKRSKRNILKRPMADKHEIVECTECRYKTNRMYSLKRHVNAVHRREKPYHCPSCEYRASVNSCLVRHILAKHSKGKKYKCQECEYSTVRIDSLKKHKCCQRKKKHG